MRMRRKPWAEKEIEINPFAVNEPYDNFGQWNTAVFKNDNPICVEIGSGKGSFIIENALKYPEKNFIGLEKQISVFAIAIKKIREIDEVFNIRMLNTDGNSIENLFSAGEVDEIFINFCDPWPKERWAKRRLTHRNFLSKYRGVLKKGGELILKTDDKALFQFSLNELLETGWQVRNVSLDLHGDIERNPSIENIKTEYEQKFSAKGMSIYKLTARTYSPGS